ncbi:bifunctional 3-oxoadipate enol-lactonase/4-carboxymuconolactone decarboxylase PcaDC [Mycolicibacter virginiensis]|uniref:4-carboxymuconolactone decarboxylase n=1 Tax=Mycolicibacter virginiensis TaxID=1795032 RepID=A0A9X7IMN5_9MYCO|nr:MULTISPECIES: 4-carboxymuconolactone decarboxylase [Mycobacteriaceae]PQM51764.1 4-carboxymuconolactone decarboxylase [Mycolicibacter virginiensis]ULP46233.1 4-carboxymuconolactone decarboxylase [Mycolicibacter virginiensis]
MSVPRLVGTDFGGPPNADLLLLGPSLGTSATALWGLAAEQLAERLRVVAWDLPGHGRSPAASFRMPDLAAGVLSLADEIAPRAAFHYAGNSIGGAVGLQLLLDAPERVSSATLQCTGAAIGRAEDWAARAETVRTSGTDAVVEASLQRWFAPGFIDRAPGLVAALVDALRGTDNESYAQACEALADFDVTARLGQIAAPVLAIAGSHDGATPPELLGRIASGVQHGRLVVLDDVGHLAPAEAPKATVNLILAHLMVRDPAYTAGMSVRRQVLGNEHVDRTIARTTEFTADFQDLITRYAWGNIWARDGLDRRSRSIVTLTALVARGHHEELAMHLRAARRNGLSNDEIKEVLLQTAIYCGVPDANTAFRIAAQVLADHDSSEDQR